MSHRFKVFFFDIQENRSFGHVLSFIFKIFSPECLKLDCSKQNF